MKTAVEWLVDILLHKVQLTEIEKMYIEQAKQMEKEQLMDAYYYDPNCDEIKDAGEEYYNETFGKTIVTEYRDGSINVETYKSEE
jgi:hypothetical protein